MTKKRARKTGQARWLVLTPSVDDAAWRREIERAAEAAGLQAISTRSAHDADDLGDAKVIFITEDAEVALASGAKDIAAIIPEPESAPDAVGEAFDLIAPHSVWYASTLLARAAGLADTHAIVTARDLSRRPRLLRFFGELEVTPPASAAEASRRPAISAAFNIYRNVGLSTGAPVPWSEKLFVYDDKGSRNWSDWGVLDVTGRPRMLVWGPYVALPPGTWRAVIRFGLDEAAAKHQYRIDWGTRTACVSEYVTPAKPGMYEIELDWRFVEAEAAEIRLILTEGSFMGTVIFQGMTVERVPDAEIPSDQAAA